MADDDGSTFANYRDTKPLSLADVRRAEEELGGRIFRVPPWMSGKAYERLRNAVRARQFEARDALRQRERYGAPLVRLAVAPNATVRAGQPVVLNGDGKVVPLSPMRGVRAELFVVDDPLDPDRYGAEYQGELRDVVFKAELPSLRVGFDWARGIDRTVLGIAGPPPSAPVTIPIKVDATEFLWSLGLLSDALESQAARALYEGGAITADEVRVLYGGPICPAPSWAHRAARPATRREGLHARPGVELDAAAPPPITAAEIRERLVTARGGASSLCTPLPLP